MKKVFAIAAILTSCFSTAASAANVYVGPSLFLEHLDGSHATYLGIRPQLALGYGGLITETNYFAAELNASPGTIQLADNYKRGRYTTRATTNFSFSILPGYMLTDQVLGYLRIGVVAAKFTAPDIYRTGVRVGLGLQTGLTESFDIRGEYDYTAYHSMRLIGSPKSNMIGVGLTYKIP